MIGKITQMFPTGRVKNGSNTVTKRRPLEKTKLNFLKNEDGEVVSSAYIKEITAILKTAFSQFYYH